MGAIKHLFCGPSMTAADHFAIVTMLVADLRAHPEADREQLLHRLLAQHLLAPTAHFAVVDAVRNSPASDEGSRAPTRRAHSFAEWTHSPSCTRRRPVTH
jgi:hypothetical protein